MGGMKLNNNSIMKKWLIPMVLVMILQAGLFSGTLLWGGTIEQLDRNAFDILNERVINRKNYIENDMLQRWSKVGTTSDRIAKHTDSILAHRRMDPENLKVDTTLTGEVLSVVAPELMDMIRKNSVTGGFVIFGGGKVDAQTGETQRAGIYIRDPDPSSSPQDNSDLLMERSPISVAKQLGITLDTKWSAQFQLSKEDPGDDFFNKPFQAALDYPEISSDNLGYWSKPFSLSQADIPVITYSQPLRSQGGALLGVIGVELSLDHLRSRLPYDELSNNKKGAYLLAVDHGKDRSFENVLPSGPLYHRLFQDLQNTQFESQPVYNNSYRLEKVGKVQADAYGCIQYFNLYNSNTPFEEERWALIGLMEEDSITLFSRRVTTSVLLSLVISLTLGILAVFFAGTWFTRPITALVRKVRDSDPSRPVVLEKINLSEIDELSSAIEYLSRNVADSASRLSQIIEMADIPIGAFEQHHASNRVYCTGRFLEVLHLKSDGDSGAIEAQAFGQLMGSLEEKVESREDDDTVRILCLSESRDQPCWVRMKVITDKEKTMGVVTDITQEMLERRKIERERDYDVLTNLYNRRAFVTRMKELLRNPARIQTAALIMLDLDNLKYINDTYGHDYGDEYIRCTAALLKRYTPFHTVVSRISGDEFRIFIYGYPAKEQVRELINTLKEGIMETRFPLPDNRNFRVRASAGIAWYPDDADSFDVLMKYADFAMYRVKNTTKGEFNEFDRGSYNRDSYLLHSKEELNRLIDDQLVEYAFQPIVDVRTGEIFGYEALMRSMLASLKSPAEVLAMARSQFKLYQIERLTWSKALQAFSRLQVPEDCKVFVNSIANQTLTHGDLLTFEEQYPHLLSRIVIELTEEEKLEEECTQIKQEYAKRWNAQIALDDFGTGYNSDVALLSITPDFVKIDMSIVRNIDTDLNRQKIMQNLLSYTQGRHIKVIAEGVETREELETLVRCGVDYIQGYYLSVPAFLPVPVDPVLKAELVGLYEKYHIDL